MAELRMPSLGADMDSGVLLEWLVHAGEQVKRGEIVAVVDTAKAAVEIESFDTGTVDRLLVEPGTSVPVGTPLATITTGTVAAEPPAAEPPVARPPTAAAAPPAPAGPSVVTSPLVRHLAADEQVDLATVRGSGVGGRITHADVRRAAAAQAPVEVPPPGDHRRVSPLARRIATELGVDLATVTGTGPGGAIGVEDVRRTATGHRAAGATPTAVTEAAREAPEPGDRTDAMRAAIAALMARSKREIPHYYLAETVDLATALRWLRDRNRQLAVRERILPAALLLKAAARALATVPELNGFWTADRFVAADSVHLGVAVSLRGGGLVAPAIHHADRLSLPDLMAALRDLAIRTRAGRLRRAELADPTITVSNLGEQGVEQIHGVIYPPQVALVGFGRITERPWAVDGLIGVRPLVTVSLAGDHRATDGATGARYLTAVAQLLQRPEEL
jgi:pyruvate dehydrogenase E2 component (dihydrolipoamide acetyltransferase)